MKYSEDLIEEVRVRNDIVTVISQYVRLTRSGSSSYKGLCPFHNEKTPSFSVSGQKQLYHCFGCGASGNVFNFVMQYENVSFSEALSQLAERAGVTLPKIEYSAQAKELSQKKTDLLAMHRFAAQYYYTLLKQDVGRDALAYLQRRGLSNETIRSFGLGYSDAGGQGLYHFLKGKGYSDELLKESGLFLLDDRRNLLIDKFRGRVMFPIMDPNSRVIGFGGRVMGDEKPKYLNSPETIIFEKRRNLYGLHAARKSREDFLILCEGYMDVIAMHQAGFTNAVASLGTALTPGHATLMRHYAKQVLLIYDSDGAGIRATQRAVPILREASLPSRVVNLQPHKDPDEFIRAEGAEAFRERLQQAEDSFMKLVDIEASLRNLADPQGQNLFFDAVAMLLFDLGDGVERRVYADAVAKKYGPSGMTSQDLLGRVSTLAMKGVRPLREQQQPSVQREEKRNKAPKEKGSVVAQKLILTWIVNYPSLTGLIMEY
ncbi:MAG: DNA primase, partial [Blautia sp.]|nr:DNA primase [Blautia sp.]